MSHLRNETLGFKIVLLGDHKAGKTALVSQLRKMKFVPAYTSDTVPHFEHCHLNYEEKQFRHVVWTLPASNIKNCMGMIDSPMKADAVVLVFDLTNKDSFYNLTKYIDCLPRAIPLFLVGTKSDLARAVTEAEIMRFGNRHNCKYLATSAKDNSRVDELLPLVTQTIHKLKRMAVFDNSPLFQTRNTTGRFSNVDLTEPSAKQASKRASLESKLLNYITRIEGYVDSKNNVDYRRGFWFFARQRGNNRRVNFHLASQLLTALRTTKDSITTIFSNLETKRDEIIKNLKLQEGDFIAQGINSSELNSIINEAHKEDSEEQSLLSQGGGL